MKVKDVFLKKNLMGQNVTLEGKMYLSASQMGAGFIFRSHRADLHDMAKNEFSLPSMPNKQVAASGTIAKMQNNIVLIATGVEVK